MMGENPFLSDPNVNKVRKALAALEFLVVQDIFLTETAEFADVVLPATSFMEKEGTYTNTDRRVQIGRKVLEPPGEARADWQTICEISNRIGLPMDYESPREVFDEMVALAPAYAGLRYDNLGPTGKLYPNADPEHSDGTVVLFDGGVRDRGRQGASRAGRVDAREGAPGRRVPVRAQHGPAARALAHGVDDAALVRARRDRARGEGVHRLRGRRAARDRRRRLRARDEPARLDRAQGVAHAPRDTRAPASSRSTSARRPRTC